MKFVTLLTLLAATSVVTAFGQNSSPPARSEKTAPPRPAPVVSPEINADRSVTFRLRAPNANQVSVRGQWTREPVVLTKSAEAMWTGTTTLPAGVWEYSFIVDGLIMIDPANPAIKPMREPRTSIVHLPAQSPHPWDFQDVPHGAVHQHSYRSKALDKPRELWVYTPPGYERALTSARYPLLVLQHGSGDNQQTWVVHGKAHWILDSLIATGKAQPMVVVMIDGHPFTPAEMGDPAKRTGAIAAFRRELFEDALPLVEATYRVSDDGNQRGIAGLSMGGGQSLTIGLGDLGRFAYVGCFSGSSPEASVVGPFLASPAMANAKLRLLWIACGRDDALHTRNEDLVSKLSGAGIKHEWYLTTGNHSWPVWRTYLVDFLPRLFQTAQP